MTSYHFTDNLSLEVKAGIPPKVDIQGKGKIYAPLTGIATPEGLGVVVGDLPLKKDIFITDLEAHKRHLPHVLGHLHSNSNTALEKPV
jgi:hypothetical protein